MSSVSAFDALPGSSTSTASSVAPKAQRSSAGVFGLAGFASILSAIAGFIHFRVAGDHLQWWRVAGLYFIVIGIAQMQFALSAACGMLTERLIALNVFFNAVTVSLYVASRTVGLPFEPPVYSHGMKAGPGIPIVPGATERIGVPDLLALLCEVMLIIVLVVRLEERYRRSAGRIIEGAAGIAIATSVASFIW